MTRASSPAALAKRLGYTFKRPELLARALTHRSFGAEHNERLEFVGDAVLDCVIGVALFERLPDIAEGDLSRLRAHLVNGETLARLAQGLELDGLLRFGEGERRSGGRGRASAVADALEAIFGAVFVDGGFEAARDVILAVFAQDLAQLDPALLGKDPKTRLQEWLQARRLPVPVYAVVEASGAAHARTFVVECRIEARDVATRGEGANRRTAEQNAAAAAYAIVAAGDASSAGG